jgi:2-methylcitrate dehydratase
VALLYGTLTAEHYEDAVAQDPRIDELRRRVTVVSLFYVSHWQLD